MSINVDIVKAGGDIRAYLKSVGVNHLNKPTSVDAVKGALAKCTADTTEIYTTVIKTVFGEGYKVDVEVGDDIAVKVDSGSKKGTISTADILGNGCYIGDLFILIVKEINNTVNS